MTNADDKLRGVDDPRLAIHASSGRPAWLWTLDGARIVWANPVGASLFGARSSAALSAKAFRSADPHRRQIVQLGQQLPASGAIRLQRLRGFGAPLGALVTCACSRLDFADGQAGILIVAAAPIGRAMPLIERLQRLVEGIDTPIASFAPDGLFIGASEAARALIGFRDLTDASLDAARKAALQSGRAELPIGIGHMVLQRVGSGADVALVALLAPGAAQSEHLRPQVALDAESEAPPAAESSAEDSAAPESPVEEIAAAGEAADSVAAPEPDLEPASEAEPLAEPEAAAEPTLPAAATDVAAPPADYEAPETTGEAPAEYGVIDDVAAQLGDHALVEPEAAQAEPDPAPELAQVGAEIVPTPDETPAEAIGEPPAPEIAPAQPNVPEPEPAAEAEPAAETTAPAAEPDQPASAWCDEPLAEPRRHPLRFTWQLDAEGRFSIGSDEFSRLIGPRTSAGFGRLWSEIAEVFGLDPDRRFAEAIASRRTWSGITLLWPVDVPDQRLRVEMSGLPAQDRDGRYIGYRGFGVCRDLEGLTRLAALRRGDTAELPPRPLSADCPPAESVAANPSADIPQPSAAGDFLQPADPESNVETPHNVLPFRPTVDGRSLSLTPVENSAFNELARQLSARLESDALELASDTPSETLADEASAPPSAPSPVNEQPDWLAPAIAPARGDSSRDRLLLDLLPVGVLIYRLDRLLYANAAFLARMGYDSLNALEQAGGLDVLFVESEVESSSSSSETGAPITIAPATTGSEPPHRSAAGRLHSISWDTEPAMALIFSGTEAESQAENQADGHEPDRATPSIAAGEASPVGHVNAEELAAILDTTTDGVVMFDAGGRLHACNRSAEALFGVNGDELMQKSLTELFAPESQATLAAYLETVKNADAQSLLDHGRDLLGLVHNGGMLPLAVIIGRTSADGPNYFAVFRDLSQARKTETELAQARRLAEHSASAKADVLARLSHEIRTPLNAILGFAEVMIEERLGALGNERYTEYLKDIRASGERVISVINDLLDLSRIETGQLDLAFAPLNLNEMVEQCVGVMQPHANRERIIIRTSLAHTLPPVSADAAALRQIALNLIATSIGLANAGGQVIVSTALSDSGEVMLRVRDTGQRLNDDELAAAMQPFRSAPSDSATEASGVSLSLTKALVEANHARFQIKTAPHSGTLIEVIFAPAHAQA
uniref:histidine kinase n=1 Tax=Rhodopseudomonas palustris (strain BisA53) TaxID=316055 RepID=Q07J95_RHOP5